MHIVKMCLIDNYILDKEDFSNKNINVNTNADNIKDIKPIDINAIEGD